MNFIFILPIKMTGSLDGGNLINLAAVEKTKRKNIIGLQYNVLAGVGGKYKNKIEFFFKTLGREGR